VKIEYRQKKKRAVEARLYNFPEVWKSCKSKGFTEAKKKTIRLSKWKVLNN